MPRLILLTLIAGLAVNSAFPQGEIRRSDSLVRQVFTAQDSSLFEAAAEAYLALLNAQPQTKEESEILRKHFASVALVMPREERPDNFDTITPQQAEQIVLWWRRQDPYPATRRNERLEEHLSRWAFAMAAFHNDRNANGFDERGEIFVRLGPPQKQIAVELTPNMTAFDFTNSISVPDLPDNETWVYRHVHDEAYYFFVRESKKNGYRLSRPSEMIPARLKDGLDSRTDRGRERTQVLLLVMEEVYAHLALAHPIFGSTYDAIVGFRGLPPSSQHRPELFARSTLATASNIETESAGRREDVVPASYTNTTGMTEELPLEARIARFLDRDGSTRTEVFWSVDTGELQPSRRLAKIMKEAGFTESEDFLLALSVTRQSADYRQQGVETKHYLLQPTPAEKKKVQSISVTGDTSLYHLAIQWTQHWSEKQADGSLAEGALLKMATTRFDTLQPLHSEGSRLEMSDLKPVEAERETPFPYRRLSSSAPPDLIFELYNLNFGQDDRTHYSIEYEVARGGDRRTTATRARTSSSGADRNVSERIALDLSDVRERGPIEITVRVIDDVTNEQIARSIGFYFDQ